MEHNDHTVPKRPSAGITPGDSSWDDPISPTIPGVGPGEAIETNKAGGKQRHSPYRMDLLPHHALLRTSRILAQGAETHGEDNWRMISVQDHLNRALIHITCHLAGDAQDDHLSHAACRILFALDLYPPTKD